MIRAVKKRVDSLYVKKGGGEYCKWKIKKGYCVLTIKEGGGWDGMGWGSGGLQWASQGRRGGFPKSKKEDDGLIGAVYRRVEDFLDVKEGREGMIKEDQRRRTVVKGILKERI